MLRPRHLVLLTASWALAASYNSHSHRLSIASTACGASIEHTNSYSSLSFEPAFWEDFIGNISNPNTLVLGLIEQLVRHGGQPNIRPGGITMDSMDFDPNGGDVTRITSPKGAVYRTIVGPGFYQSWDNFPKGTRFTSTLNFGNDSIPIARDLAVASVKYQASKIDFFELGNEANNYPSSRWGNSTAAYVQQWKNFTQHIDVAVNKLAQYPQNRWWGSSSTTDDTSLNIRPADLIPAGIDSRGQIGQFSIHSYAFATCDPARTALATIPNILNHTGLTNYADTEIMPSARASLAAGVPWIIGEFNSIACSGNPGVSDTFAQALWTIDTELIYAARNASAVYLHQGATLTSQSSNQFNQPPPDGSPLWSSYSFAYPLNSTGRGPARVNPGYYGLLYIAEALAENGTRVRALDAPQGISNDRFAGYALYQNDRVSKVALVNMKPYYQNSTSLEEVRVDLSGIEGWEKATVKRLTASFVEEKESRNITWAGQSYENVEPTGKEVVESLGKGGSVRIRGSEAVLVSFC